MDSRYARLKYTKQEITDANSIIYLLIGLLAEYL